MTERGTTTGMDTLASSAVELTTDDLDAMPDDGCRRELVDGRSS